MSRDDPRRSNPLLSGVAFHIAGVTFPTLEDGRIVGFFIDKSRPQFYRSTQVFQTSTDSSSHCLKNHVYENNLL